MLLIIALLIRNELLILLLSLPEYFALQIVYIVIVDALRRCQSFLPLLKLVNLKFDVFDGCLVMVFRVDFAILLIVVTEVVRVQVVISD